MRSLYIVSSLLVIWNYPVVLLYGAGCLATALYTGYMIIVHRNRVTPFLRYVDVLESMNNIPADFKSYLFWAIEKVLGSLNKEPTQTSKTPVKIPSIDELYSKMAAEREKIPVAVPQKAEEPTEKDVPLNVPVAKVEEQPEIKDSKKEEIPPSNNEPVFEILREILGTLRPDSPEYRILNVFITRATHQCPSGCGDH